MSIFCFHDFQKWSVLIPSYNGHKTQFRTCHKCGVTKFRDLGYCDGVQADQANSALKAIANFEDKP